MKKAAVAVAHRILVIAWHILAEAGAECAERGETYFDRRHPDRTARALTKRLEAIGYEVTLTSTADTATPRLDRNSAPGQQPTSSCVDPSICQRCARWALPRCVCLVKRKPRNPPAVSPTAPTT